jgi:hypothetical protein
MASILWFMSGLTTSNIVFIDNFTVTASPYYSFIGNPELQSLFLGFGVIMLLLGFFTALKQAANVGWIKGGN